MRKQPREGAESEAALMVEEVVIDEQYGPLAPVAETGSLHPCDDEDTLEARVRAPLPIELLDVYGCEQAAPQQPADPLSAGLSLSGSAILADPAPSSRVRS